MRYLRTHSLSWISLVIVLFIAVFLAVPIVFIVTKPSDGPRVQASSGAPTAGCIESSSCRESSMGVPNLEAIDLNVGLRVNVGTGTPQGAAALINMPADIVKTLRNDTEAQVLQYEKSINFGPEPDFDISTSFRTATVEAEINIGVTGLDPFGKVPHTITEEYDRIILEVGDYRPVFGSPSELATTEEAISIGVLMPEP